MRDSEGKEEPLVFRCLICRKKVASYECEDQWCGVVTTEDFPTHKWEAVCHTCLKKILIHLSEYYVNQKAAPDSRAIINKIKTVLKNTP